MSGIDLHVHSNHSDDGDYTPEALVAMARAAGIDRLAIADHNCVTAVKPAAEAGRALGVEIIPAIEIDCHLEGVPLHILGYNIDIGDIRYRELRESVTKREREASGKRIELVERLGFAVDRTAAAALARNGVVTAEMIAEILLSSPAQRSHPLLQPFLPGGSRSDNPYVNFYWDICSHGKPAHVPVEFMPLADAVRLITDTGGSAVVAHPGINLKDRGELLADLATAGVRGVEVYSGYHTAEDRERWRKLAETSGMFTTCGSDFHGKTKPAIRLGGHGCAALTCGTIPP